MGAVKDFDPGRAVAFLEDAARYFETRQTNGEDRAHWSNVYNAKNCREIAEALSGLVAKMARRDRNENRHCLNYGPCSRMDAQSTGETK